MQNTFNNKKFRSLLPYLLLVIVAIIAYKVITEISYFTGILGNIWNIITPFFYGFLLAYIINIPYSGFNKLFEKSKFRFLNKFKTLLSSIITFLIFSLFIFVILRLVIPYILRILTFFISNLPAYYETIIRYIDYINSLELFGFHISKENILNSMQDFFQSISLETLAYPLNAIFGVTSTIFTGILALISSIYILMEKEKIKGFFCRIIRAFAPANVSNTIIEYTRSLNKNFRRYVNVQTIDGIILGTIVTIELLIMRSPYALVLGIALGIVNYIPYFGSIFGSIFVVIIVAFTQDIKIAAIAAVVLLITQQIDGNIIQPRLMGGSFSLSPLLVIISITIGGAFAGALGMIAAIPIIAVLKDILEKIITHYEQKKLEKPEH